MPMQQPAVPIVSAVTRRIVIDLTPTAAVGQYTMLIATDGIPEGWETTHRILVDALQEAARQWARQERQKGQQDIPHLVIAGNGERH